MNTVKYLVEIVKGIEKKIFIFGNSSGGTIAQYLAVHAGSVGGFPGWRLMGLAFLHPFYGGKSKEVDDMVMHLFQLDHKRFELDPRLKPAAEDLARIPCERILVAMAGDDDFGEAGLEYHQALKNVGWKGPVEIEHSAPGGRHCFVLYEPNHDRTLDFIQRLSSLINKDMGVAMPKMHPVSRL